MSGRGGRGRFRRASRFEDNFGSRNISNKNPPSRHLWVGNLSHATLEHDLSHYFLQFGELESVAFQPGRSYAFINFKREEDAFVAINALQGFSIAGNPLRIEFTKADKPSTPLRDEDYSQHHDGHSASRGSPFSQREFRARHASPDPFYPEKFNGSDKSVEPSSVLWVGFPALLKVDEMILRKAFSPFGEIEKITAFPGRSYAFVRFRSVVSAFRAKEILQGKLFGNPRVHICFAKSETGSSNGARSSMNVPPSPHSKSNIHLGYSGNLRQDRNFGSLSGDLGIRSQFLPDLDAGDSDAHGFKRKRTSWMGGNNACELARFGDVGSDLGPPHDIYEHRDSSTREGRAPLSDYPEDPWDLSEDVNFFHGAKKLKTGPFPPEKDLPEHPFSDLKQEKHRLPKVFSDFPRHEVFNKNFEAVFHVNKQSPDHTNIAVPHGERSDQWGESYDSFQVGSGSLLSKPIEKKRFMPESDQSSLNEWKWEGTIAKGGTPVCRARCFPVGKVLDIMLPEFLDCTARTGLDMLSKHYYQAAKAWVVFFVPESDADMGFYNELMHYLGEKQRAAVAKLDEKTTLFLVPPSDFSEKVLKVPGKLSISGVVLRLEHPGSSFGSLHLQNEKKNINSLPINSDAPYTKPSTASLPIHPLTSFQDLGKLGVPNASFSGNVVTSAPLGSFSGSAHALNGVSDSYNENRHDYQLHQGNPMSGQNLSSHHLQNSISGPRDVPSQVSNCAVPVVQEHHSFVPNTGQETSSSHYKGGISGISLSGNGKSFLQETHTSASLSVAALQPDQLAQLASSLLGQQRQSGSTSHISLGDEFRSTNRTNDSENSLRISQKYVLQNNQVSSELSTSQFGQVQQLQQQQQRTSNVPAVSRMIQGVQGNQLLQNGNTQKEAEADPQKRLQATLQLAAALLQQIQQGKGS
ncbi:flowering time control protein FPA [Carya illinoinensis]|nr:flowering time control protein FPA [Carya illinoinensis]